jgi:hypothetical protein
MKKPTRKTPQPQRTGTGIRVIAFLLVAGGIYHFFGIRDYRFYHFMFQQLPEDLIRTRYVLSLCFRGITIIAGVGLWLRREMFRKLTIGLCLWTLLIVYFKHPFYVFKNLAIYSEYQVWDTSGHYPLEYPLHPYISMYFYYALDIIFSVAVIYYLRRPRVKELFRKPSKNRSNRSRRNA